MKINRLKKLTAIAVSVMIALGALNLSPGLLPNTAYADGEKSGACGENLTWSFDGSTGTLTISGEGDMYDYTDNSDSFAPWRSYASIGSIKFIEFDGEITSIGSCAFVLCSEVTSITIPGSVTRIGDDAFPCAGLTSVSIPDSVTSIGHNAFNGCCELTSVNIGKGVTSIGDGAFDGCSGLTSITIPDSVISIGRGAFYGCSGLTSVTIPSSLTSIGENAFGSCTELESLIVAEENPVYHSSGNCIIENESKTLTLGCKNSIIPDDGSVTSIGSLAFFGCSGLSNIIIPSQVTSIAYFAFMYCSGLTSINIPDSVINIGDRAFSSCSGLESITVDEDNPVYHSSGNCLIETSSKYLVAGCKNSVIPDDGSVTIIGSEAFCKCAELKSITIPDSVTNIVSYAFCDCTGLAEITIPVNVSDIGMYAFRGCTGLTELTVPAKSIGSGAFDRCTGLKSVTIGKGVISIGSSPFSTFHYCSGLETITVDKDNPVYHSSGNCIVETETKTLIAGCKNSIIPDDGSITSIGYGAFEGCFELTSITIPEGITSIGEYAFRDCFALTSIVIPNSITNITSNAVFQCSDLSDVYYSGSKAQWNVIIIEEGNDPLLNATIHFNYKPAVNHIYDYGGYGRGMTDQIRINGADNVLRLTVTALTPQENEGFDANPYGCSMKFELAPAEDGAAVTAENPAEILVKKDYIGTKRDSIVIFQYVTNADGSRSRVSYTFSKNDSRYRITDNGDGYWKISVYTISAA